MKCMKTGWYNEDNELVASDRWELMDFLEEEGELMNRLVEYVCDNYDFEDFVEEMFRNESFYASPEELREEYAENEIIEGEDFELFCYEYLTWFEKGDNMGDEEEEEDDEEEEEEE